MMKRLLTTLLTSMILINIQAIELKKTEEKCVHEFAKDIDAKDQNTFLAITFDNPPADITISCDDVYNFLPTATTDCVLGDATVNVFEINFETNVACPVVFNISKAVSGY